MWYMVPNARGDTPKTCITGELDCNFFLQQALVPMQKITFSLQLGVIKSVGAPKLAIDPSFSAVTLYFDVYK